MALRAVGQPGKPQGLTWSSRPCCVQPMWVLLLSPQHITAPQLLSFTQEDSMLSQGCVSTRPAYKVSIYRPWGTCSFSLLGDRRCQGQDQGLFFFHTPVSAVFEPRCVPLAHAHTAAFPVAAAGKLSSGIQHC